MERIARLSLEQRAALPRWRDEWLRIGSSVAPADRSRAERAITEMYARLGEGPPRFVWCESPATGAMMKHTLRKLANDQWSMDLPWMWPEHGPHPWWHPSLRSSLESSLRGSLASLPWLLDATSRASLGSWLGRPLDVESSVSALQASLSPALEASLEPSLLSTLNLSLERYLELSLQRSSFALRLNLQLTIEQGLRSTIHERLMGDLYGPLWDQTDACWVGSYAFFRDVLGVNYSAEASSHLDLWSDVVRSSGWWWPYHGLCIVCERPDRVGWDLDNHPPRLHSEMGPALHFRDGWSVYCVRGMRVPPDIIDDRGSITVTRIDKEADVELRRVMIDLYGRGRFLRDAGAEVVHRDRFGTLWRRRVGDGPMLMVEVKNTTPEPDGSYREFFLSVHPELRPILDDGTLGEPQQLTAHNAVASTFGLRGEDYWPTLET